VTWKPERGHRTSLASSLSQGKVPFAVSRNNWLDSDYVVVTKVIPKGDYGIAYGFPVSDGIPNDHFRGYRKWEETMEVPNAGAYQWRKIELSELQIQELVAIFEDEISPRYKFGQE
jgi:hypothetical protein